jgi:CheY-like chemotaxis protein
MPHKLLLADDSVTIQRVIELTFADEDVNVVAVSDGDQAIQRIEAAPPDIVLADIGMPGKNGYEVAQHIRQSPRLAHIPVVLLTGAFEPVDQARADEAGCDGVLAKPFEPQLVIGRVKELLAKPRSKGEGGEQVTGGWPPPEPLKGPAAAPSIELHEYFDRLDAAFSNLTPAKPLAPATGTPPPLDIDWFGEKAGAAESDDSWEFPAPPADAPPRVPVPADTRAALASMPPSPAGLPVAPQQAAPVPAARSAELPPLADAFAAFLAAEQGDADATPAALWPVAPASASAPAARIDDALIEEVTRRVLERLSDQVVRETVGDIVSRVAQQLVRQEIDRIKSQLR